MSSATVVGKPYRAGLISVPNCSQYNRSNWDSETLPWVCRRSRMSRARVSSGVRLITADSSSPETWSKKFQLRIKYVSESVLQILSLFFHLKMPFDTKIFTFTLVLYACKSCLGSQCYLANYFSIMEKYCVYPRIQLG